jgi:hypothetical protein
VSLPFHTFRSKANIIWTIEHQGLVVLHAFHIPGIHVASRESDGERRSLPERALDPNVPTVQGHDLPCQRQANPAALVASGDVSLDLCKAFKYMFELILGNANAVILNLDGEVAVRAHQTNVDHASVRVAELKRVGKKVVEDFRHLPHIHFDEHRAVSALDEDSLAFGGFEIGRHVPYQGDEIHAHFSDVRPPALEPGKVQQFIDQEQQSRGIPESRLNHCMEVP